MNVRCWLFSIAAIGSAACRAPTVVPAHAAAHDVREGPREAVIAVLERQRDAWNRGDIVAFMDAYVHDETLVFTSGGKVRRGWNATLERYRTRYVDSPDGPHAQQGKSRMGKLEFWDLETSVLSDAVVVVLGRWRLTETPEAGEGVFTLVFVRRGGNWQILHDHTSAATPSA